MAPEGIEGIEEVQPGILPPPDDPSFHNGIGATAPANTSPQPNGSNHNSTNSAKSSDLFEPSNRCRINIMLVSFILCIGLAITVIGVYMFITMPFSVRDGAIWAGVPLTISGITGIYYCGHEFAAYARSMKAFVVKCICLILTFISCWLSILACVFTAIHTSHIFSYIECTFSNDLTCSCVKSMDPLAPVYTYTNTDCGLIKTEFWKFILSQCVLSGVGSIVCMWFLFMLWKSRYHGFYAGLRFYSYSATLSTQPRISV